MKHLKVKTALLLLQLLFASFANAGDFDWLKDLNVKAEADSSGFRAQLTTRFRIGDADVKAVFGNVDRKSDAYMVLRLGELSHRPVKDVMSVYKANKKKGWGVIAKKLGIKPGSNEFHALKRGHDLDNHRGQSIARSFENGKNKGKSNGKNKGKK